MRASNLVVVALLLPVGALAWTHTGIWYTWMDHPYEDGWDLNQTTVPSDMDVQDTAKALQRAFARWNAADLDVQLWYDGKHKTADLQPDGLYSVLFSDNWEEWGTDNALAFAASWAWEDGAGLDCDVVFLTENQWGAVRWDTSSTGPASGHYDMEAVAVHEWGHCLGLGHSDSSAAVMYAYYQGIRDLDQDDIDGAAAIYGTDRCTDADGDGYTDCDLDCDDDNALVHPGADEVCNAADDNCDGVVDAAAELTVLMADPDQVQSQWADWISVGNAFAADEATMLRRARLHVRIDEPDVRLEWAIYASDAVFGPWELVRTEPGFSDGDGDHWEASPELDIPLEKGRYYQLSMGVFAEDAVIYYDRFAPLDTQGPITPTGYVYSRSTADPWYDPDGDYLCHMELDVVDLPDQDGDGLTSLCGDCDDADPLRYEGAEELCDSVDNDCNGVVDDGWADEDADGDGVYDCLDPCPVDERDDRDGDGSCDSDDPCPDDPDDLCDAEDTDDTDPVDTDAPESPGDCACTTGSAAVPWVLLSLLAVALRRRRG